MPTEIIETHEMDTPELELQVDGVEEVDPRFCDLFRVVLLVEQTLEEIHGRMQDGQTFQRDYLAELFVAHQTGARVLNRDDVETWAEDLTRLDDETLVELRSTVGYVPPHVGVDLELPSPDQGTDCEN